jgi:tetratricopeptide (TPR) repeat protein
MSSFEDYTQQRLNFARDLLKSGELQRALTVCEQLLSPASMLSHGADIFMIIADALEISGDTSRADIIRERAHVLIEESRVDLHLTMQSSEKLIEDILPLLHVLKDDPAEKIVLDEIMIHYPTFESRQRKNDEKLESINHESSPTLSALEELAKRLEKARIPVIEEDKTLSSPSFMPSIVTETMANIYVQQGAYAQAIKAYQVLARNHPERLEYFESIIADLRLRQS